MAETTISPSPELHLLATMAGATSRRRFLRWAGVSVIVAAAGCGKKGDSPTGPPGGGTDKTFPYNDAGLLNYYSVLEQMSAAFYGQAIATAWAGRTAEETALLTEIRDHEIAHRDFLKGMLGGGALPDFQFSFSSTNFADRSSTLTTARTLEDLAISAYNGGARVFADFSTMAKVQRIASVEGRHAAVIRDLQSPRSAAFAGDDVVNATTGLDATRWPSEVLTIADGWITTHFTNGLP